MKAMATELRGEISSAVNKMLLAQLNSPLPDCCLRQSRSSVRDAALQAGCDQAPVPVSDSPVVGLLQVLSEEHGRISHAAKT